MTDETSVDNLVSADSTGDISSAGQEQPSEQLANQAPTEQERTFTQSELNKIVSSRVSDTHKVYETRAAQTQSQPVAQQQAGGVDEAKIREMISSQVAELSRSHQAAAENQRHVNEANRIYSNIDENAKANIPADEMQDYLASLTRVNGFVEFPGVLQAVHDLDNSAEVLRHLSSDEGVDKLAGMKVLSDAAVAGRIKKISDRLKQNKSAKDSPSAPNPISRIETNIRDGLGGNQPATVTELRSLPEYRG